MSLGNQMLLMGKRVTPMIALSDQAANSNGTGAGAISGVSFDPSGTWQLDETVGGSAQTTQLGNWMLKGAAADYEIRVTATGSALATGSAVLGTWLGLGTTRTWLLDAAAGTTTPIAAELKVEIRLVATGRVLGSATINLSAVDAAVPSALKDHIATGTGTGTGTKAATAALQILGDGTTRAYYTNGGDPNIFVALENWTNGTTIIPDSVIVTATKTTGGGNMFNINSGLGSKKPLTAGVTLTYETREPDNGQIKTVIVRCAFYRGSTYLYTATITLIASRGGGTPGVV
jgi:hypothetical protein